MQLVVEGVRARQLQDALLMEKQTMDRAFQQANSLVDYFEIKASRIGDQVFLVLFIPEFQPFECESHDIPIQVRQCSDQVQRLAEDRVQNSVTLENCQRRLLDASKSSQRMTQSLEESQSKLDNSRIGLAKLQIDLEKER